MAASSPSARTKIRHISQDPALSPEPPTSAANCVRGASEGAGDSQPSAPDGYGDKLHSHYEWNIWNDDVVQLRVVMSSDAMTPLLRGTVDLLILQALRQEPQHGYEVSRWVHERTDGVLAVEDAALYQALHRLEDKGFIESEWGVSANNRRAKYYQLTSEGRRELRTEVSQWKRYAAAVFKAIQTV